MKTLIFGAGASRDFFNPILDTAYLTDKVCDQQEWDRIIRKYHSYNGKNKLMVNSGAVMSLIKQIKYWMPNANFEQIAEIVDKVCSYGFDNIPRNNMLNLLVWIMNTGFQPKNVNPFGMEWGDIPFLLREIIAEAILDMENHHKSEDYDTLSGLQREFIGAVCEHDSDVSVMSLNYDDCIYESLVGLGFEKGFRPTNSNYLCQLDIERFMHASKVAYFPHGHLKFQFTDNDNVTFWHDSNQANKERWESIDGLCVGSTLTVQQGRFAYNWNTFISTGQTKDDALNHMPYAVFYQRLAVDIAKSDTIYVIGYSFGDEHVNRLLRSFIKFNPYNTIYIVDYYPEPVTLVDEHHDPDNYICKVYSNLSAEWQLFYSDSSGMMPIDQTEIDKINNQGWGKLFPQVIFYKKGYREFLNEFIDVLNQQV